MNILFEVVVDKPEVVEFDGESFEVFGHVRIIEYNDVDDIVSESEVV